MLSVNQHCQGSKVAAACPTGLFHPGSPEEQLKKCCCGVYFNPNYCTNAQEWKELAE